MGPSEEAGSVECHCLKIELENRRKGKEVRVCKAFSEDQIGFVACGEGSKKGGAPL